MPEARLSQYPGKTNAPEFPAGLDWINTESPLRLQDLRGRIVLLDFWTYCCINCMHILPDLKRLEEEYPSELLVIGVHSAKFDSERNTQNILQAVMRYGIEHPVVNDSQMNLWRQYAVRAWPTVMVIDPLGKVVGGMAGEGVYAGLKPFISALVEEFDKKGQLDRRKFSSRPAAALMPKTVLSYPGKVLAHETSGRLFIADTNHNRIVVCTLSGEVQDVAGSGEEGLDDGAFESATFNHPQGLCLIGNELFVADTGNDAIRKLDLGTRQVATDAKELNSPWDLTNIGDSIYIAMAGAHQIWQLDRKDGSWGPVIGTGGEGLVDGLLEDAALAQPSGITTDGMQLYFADSETSSIRRAWPGPGGRVITLVGQGLFDFGNVDGVGDAVRLQHPLGVVHHRGILYIADTYNNRIRRLDPATRDVKSLAADFNEPGGLSAAGNHVYVADTNNHMIKRVDIHTGAVESVELSGLEKLRQRGANWSGEMIQVAEPIGVRAGSISVVVDLSLPKGYQVTAGGPSRIFFSLNEGASKHLVDRPESFPVTWNVTVGGKSTLNVLIELYYCHGRETALCFYKESLFTVFLEIDARSGRDAIRLMYNPLSA